MNDGRISMYADDTVQEKLLMMLMKVSKGAYHQFVTGMKETDSVR